jgi:hypothetical protein
MKNIVIITVIPRMFGNAERKARTATFRPSFLLINLRDLSILRTLMNLNYSAWGDRQR